MIEAATIRQIPYTHIYRKASQPDFYHLIARQRYGDKKYYPSKEPPGSFTSSRVPFKVPKFLLEFSFQNSIIPFIALYSELNCSYHSSIFRISNREATTLFISINGRTVSFPIGSKLHCLKGLK